MKENLETGTVASTPQGARPQGAFVFANDKNARHSRGLLGSPWSQLLPVSFEIIAYTASLTADTCACRLCSAHSDERDGFRCDISLFVTLLKLFVCFFFSVLMAVALPLVVRPVFKNLMLQIAALSFSSSQHVRGVLALIW